MARQEPKSSGNLVETVFETVSVHANIPVLLTHQRFLAAGVLLVLLSGFFASIGYGQSDHPISGRRIAPVMGVGGAQWLERSEREIEEMPETALNEIGIKPGMVVGDIGTGVGYFAIRIASRVGPEGKVYAEDVQPEMLTMLRSRARRAGVANIIPILGTESDPRLPAKTFDLLLMVDVYHEFSQPQKMLRKLREALKDDGRLVLLEYRKEDPAIPIRPEHKMSVEEAKLEVEAEGYQLERVSEALPRQHILIFKKTESTPKS